MGINKMEKLGKNELCCIADHLSPKDFHSYRLIAKKFNEAVKDSPAEWRCRVQVESTFTPKPDQPGFNNYKEIYLKIKELDAFEMRRLDDASTQTAENSQLMVTTPRLYQRIITPDQRGTTAHASNFLWGVIFDQPNCMSNVINTKALYRAYLKYVHPSATRNLALKNKAFFIYVLKKNKLLKSLYRSYDRNGKLHNVYYDLYRVFSHYPETAHFAEKVHFIVVRQDKFKKLRKIAKKCIPKLEATLTDEERSYLKPSI